MIIIPEIETVVITPPRTGSTSLKNAVKRAYPQSFMPYRHMEADGIPFGYDRYKKIGLVRNPIDRMWSLYKYLIRFGLDSAVKHNETYTAAMRDSVSIPFEDWLMHNNVVFTSPYDSDGKGRFFPLYTCHHPLPENRKSQFVYLRPDLGTTIWPYSRIDDFHKELGVQDFCQRENSSPAQPHDTLSTEALEYIVKWFKWDLHAFHKKGPFKDV